MSHRRLTKPALAHLLTVTAKAHERATTPLYIARVGSSINGPASPSLYEHVLASLKFGSCILPAEVSIQFIQPRNSVRVVAGKGNRKRGVRGVPKLGPTVGRYGMQRCTPSPASGWADALPWPPRPVGVALEDIPKGGTGWIQIGATS